MEYVRGNDGIRRLYILLGSIGLFAWWIFVAISTEGFDPVHIDASGWVIFAIGSVCCYAIPFGLVRGVAWVIQGFVGGTQND